LASTLTAWTFGYFGVPTAMKVKLTPEFTASWLYMRLVWSGLWGLLFLLPLLRRSAAIRGLLWGLAPSLVQLFVVFPSSSAGVLGLKLGAMTPAMVVFCNSIWGVVASYWFSMISE
jgi:hypothetical protein